jgi:hypothetical protein
VGSLAASSSQTLSTFQQHPRYPIIHRTDSESDSHECDIDSIASNAAALIPLSSSYAAGKKNGFWKEGFYFWAHHDEGVDESDCETVI